MQNEGRSGARSGDHTQSEEDAQAVLDIWQAEGRTEPTAINLVTVYESVDDWQANR
jgi:hypothetical protein